MIEGRKLAALAARLTAAAQPQTDFLAVTEETGKRTNTAGAPADLVAVRMTTINPMMLGRLTRRTPSAGARRDQAAHVQTASTLRAGAAAVCSEDFAALAPHRARLLGAFEFKGFDAPARVHAVE